MWRTRKCSILVVSVYLWPGQALSPANPGVLRQLLALARLLAVPTILCGDWGMPYVSELWTLLGFLDTAHETLVRLQLRWSDGRQWVAQCFPNDPEVVHQLFVT